jgi:NADH-quinone oxidoreductase subunit C
MEAAQIGKLLTDRFGPSILELKLDVAQPWAKIESGKLSEIALYLRDAPDTQFDFLRSLAAIDYIKESEIELVYLLFSYAHRHEFKVKVRLPRETPRVSSVQSIWPTANWHEREAYDLLGVEFDGHPDLRRLLLPDDWKGHPLRKDYREEDEYNGVSTSREYLTGMPQIPTRAPLPVANK